MVFVEHDEDEREPGAEEGECRSGDFAAEDAVFDAQDGGAGYAEEEFVLGDGFSRDLTYVSMDLPNVQWRVVAVEVGLAARIGGVATYSRLAQHPGSSDLAA